MNSRIISIAILLMLYLPLGIAASNNQPLKSVEIDQDADTLKRGALIYYNTCRLCHSLKYVKYQTLGEVGFSKSEINTMRGEKLATTPLASTTDDSAATELFGMIPPDLTLMAKARKNGPEYLYTLLTSYHEKEDGSIENSFFQGIKMPDIMAYSVAVNEEEKAAIDSKIKDVVAFLLWASDPRAQERKSMGIYVIAYLLILSGLFYAVMKRVWARLDKA